MVVFDAAGHLRLRDISLSRRDDDLLPESVNGYYSLARFSVLLPVMLMLNVAFVYGIFKLPSFTEQFFGNGGGMAEGIYNDARNFVYGAAAGL